MANLQTPARLLITDTETGDSFTFLLEEKECRIGRSRTRASLVLDFPDVSREHALVSRREQEFVLKDLGSVNGTLIDGRRVKEHTLKSGESFFISKYRIEFQDTPAVEFEQEEDVSSWTYLSRKPAEITQLPEETAEPWESRESEGEMAGLRRKAETLARLYELNRTLGSVFDLPAIFKKVSEMLFRLTPADRFLVLLRDQRTGAMSQAAVEFRPGLETEQTQVSQTVVGRVMDERVSLLSLDAASDQRLAASSSILVQRIHSVMCAPLLSPEAVLGVIYVDCCSLMSGFREHDLDLLNALAAETSIAVDNALTHSQLVNEAVARAVYGRFMPRHVIDEILADPTALSLGGSNRMVAVLFSDVRGFTSIAETIAPELVVQMLNTYFSDMSPIVFANDGLLDKYLGDGLMALFGVPFATDQAVANAVLTAVAMQKQMQKVNEDLEARRLPSISIGIGISAGTATVGYIGSDERTDYTAIGDTVNLAARLEKRAQASEIVVSESVCEALGGEFRVQPVGEIRVKGKSQPVNIYRVLWAEM
jgi:adenylate cyclase